MTNQLLDRAECGVIVGLGNVLSPFTVRLDNGRIVVQLAWPVTRRKALDVWDAVQLATESCDVVVIDGEGVSATRQPEMAVTSDW